MFGIFKNFFLDLELFAKTKKDLVSTHSQKPFLSITQDLHKIKKTPGNSRALSKELDFALLN